MIRLFSLLMALWPILLFAQAPQKHNTFGRTYSDTLPDEFLIDIGAVREHTYNAIPAELKEVKYPRPCYYFADVTSVELSLQLTNGTIYSDWPKLENYVNEVLQKVIPEELKGDKEIKAYIVKSPGLNAYMTPSGKTFIYLGLLDHIQTEAALASVLAHELAHYYLDHSIKGYLKYDRGDFRPGIFGLNRKASNRFSVDNEFQADSLEMIWLHRAGYHISGALEIFQAIQRYDERHLLRYENKWELEEDTHPTTNKRLLQLKNFYKNNDLKPGKTALVSQERLDAFKEEIKPEMLRIALEYRAYRYCIELGFKFHIFDPNNSVYIYYIMEAIRRRAYSRIDFWNEKFLTEPYHDIVKNISTVDRAKVKRKAHVFERIPSDILCLPPSELSKVQAKFYWQGEPKFITNEEAFMFFYRLGELLGQPECILSNALSMSFDKEARNKLLEKYLSYDTINYRDYAQALLDDQIESSLQDKKLCIVNTFFHYVTHGEEEFIVRDEKANDLGIVREIFKDAVKPFDNRQYLFLNDLRYSSINEYLLLEQMETLSYISTGSWGEETKLHLVDPRYWEIMKKYQVNEIEFVNCLYYDRRKHDVNLENYKALTSQNYEDFLSQTKRYRYIELFITSVREIRNSAMKIRYHHEWSQLDFKTAAKSQISDIVTNAIKGKELQTKETNRIYRNSMRVKKKKSKKK